MVNGDEFDEKEISYRYSIKCIGIMYNEPIFVDRDKAYKQLLVTCKEGIEATQEKGDLPEISKHNLGAYSSVSMEVTDETYNQETVHQAAFIGIFYAFYCHGDDR